MQGRKKRGFGTGFLRKLWWWCRLKESSALDSKFRGKPPSLLLSLSALLLFLLPSYHMLLATYFGNCHMCACRGDYVGLDSVIFEAFLSGSASTSQGKKRWQSSHRKNRKSQLPEHHYHYHHHLKAPSFHCIFAISSSSPTSLTYYGNFSHGWKKTLLFNFFSFPGKKTKIWRKVFFSERKYYVIKCVKKS